MTTETMVVSRTLPIFTDALQLSLEVVTADCLSIEVEKVELLAHAGRFAHVRYQPVAQPDPDAVICVDLHDCGFNRAIREFQAARWRGRAFPRWADWEKRITNRVWSFYPILDRLEATTEERQLVLGWAWRVLRMRRVING